jgi:hypothetical protein
MGEDTSGLKAELVARLLSIVKQPAKAGDVQRSVGLAQQQQQQTTPRSASKWPKLAFKTHSSHSLAAPWWLPG